ncbi:hypothetical protein [Mameliella alba]|uniref:hypothetical protein n=1 Tax=Mameliella alba TaxID=561184 RepID=UPI001E3D60FE|nr:hypothetical protein [Mameliella alba]
MILFLKDEPAPLTMCSREIAELLEKRHDDVKRSIETLVKRGVIELPQSEEDQIETGHGRNTLFRSTTSKSGIALWLWRNSPPSSRHGS